jgi:aminomethyltransferase
VRAGSGERRMAKRTALYEQHRSHGARMVEFAGWDMPVQYTGVIEEHTAVRARAGLFDVSHMGEIEIRGSGAGDACQRMTANDVRRLQDGQAQYTLICLPSGGIVDDVILYRFSARRFFFCVNAANREAVAAWLVEHAGEAEVIDRSDEYAQLALQGPRATTVLGRLTALALDRVRAFAFLEGRVAGQDVIVARTGYTGEDGWEIYCESPKAAPLWQALLEAGRGDGVVPAGLGARDTLRLEAALPLYGHELSRTTTPLEAGLDRFVRLDKGDFIGRAALEQQRRSGVPRRLVGLVALDPGIPRQGYLLEHEGRVVGEVTSGTKSPTLGKPIALGYVTPNCREPRTKLGVRIRNRTVMAEVVPTPFYRRGRAANAVTVEGENRLH